MNGRFALRSAEFSALLHVHVRHIVWYESVLRKDAGSRLTTTAAAADRQSSFQPIHDCNMEKKEVYRSVCNAPQIIGEITLLQKTAMMRQKYADERSPSLPMRAKDEIAG
ncbi:hypothetical protein TcCL_NonESM10226 [Trypanosoma cruzi]|nr:hypothetical protein TcCL_NonESM10226 [Trypanosoma cruzi]